MRKLVFLALGAMAVNWMSKQRRQRTLSSPAPLSTWDGESSGASPETRRIAAQLDSDDLLSPSEGGLASQRSTPGDAARLP